MRCVEQAWTLGRTLTAAQESVKFMSHSRRTRLKVDDVDAALKVRNLEPLWGFSTTNPPAFKKVATPTGTVYAAEDTEIDLSKILKAEMPAVPRDISYTGACPARPARRSADGSSQHTGLRLRESSRSSRRTHHQPVRISCS